MVCCMPDLPGYIRLFSCVEKGFAPARLRAEPSVLPPKPRGKRTLSEEREIVTMDKFKHDLLLRIVKLADALLLTVPFACCWYWYYASRISAPFYAKGNWLMIALYFVLYVMFGRVYDAFLMSMNRISEIVYSQTLAAMVSDGIMYIVIWLLTKHLPNVLPGLMAIAAQVLLSAFWAVNAHRWYFRTFPPQATAIIYDERRGILKLIDEYGLNGKYNVQCTASARECLLDMKMLAGMTVVFLSGVRSHDRNVIIKYCVANGIRVFVIPRIGDTIMSGAHPMHMFHLPMLCVQRYAAPPEYLFIKRALDIFLAGTALILLSPIFIATAFIIKAADGGPVFYRQCRLTKDGRKFFVLKFRSMQVDAEKDGIARLSTGSKDDRITPVGRFIRRYRVDELPQLLCILSGDMSIVGPRPERPEIAAEYEKDLPEFALRLQVKAGLTGYAQVYGKYNTTPYDKLQMDLMYIAHPSIIEDLKIMFATVKILFLPESSEGVAEGQTTAAGQARTELSERFL